MNIIYSDDGFPHLNITKYCTNRCVMCPSSYGNDTRRYRHSRFNLDHEPSLDEVWNALRAVRVKPTGVFIVGLSEPLLRLDDIVLPITRRIKRELDIPVKLITNGHAPLIYPQRDVAYELADSGVGWTEISLNAENARKYSHICRPTLRFPREVIFDKALEFAVQCRAAGMRTFLTMVDGIPLDRLPEGYQPDPEAFKRLAKRKGLEYMMRKYG